ncbi:MAG: uncharacterized protein KVP18_001567 [Porospora cf. gigantea A]|uniref:uncharacterized protein n=1 Tax=Porospora cf. gigantea A TaxID=2853593 RepID=UPI00355A2828|nr:MAG: hypothetical protein KVP18_001567 [Porospora cf. gigantea A]
MRVSDFTGSVWKFNAGLTVPIITAATPPLNRASTRSPAFRRLASLEWQSVDDERDTKPLLDGISESTSCGGSEDSSPNSYSSTDGNSANDSGDSGVTFFPSKSLTRLDCDLLLPTAQLPSAPATPCSIASFNYDKPLRSVEAVKRNVEYERIHRSARDHCKVALRASYTREFGNMLRNRRHGNPIGERLGHAPLQKHLEKHLEDSMVTKMRAVPGVQHRAFFDTRCHDSSLVERVQFALGSGEVFAGEAMVVADKGWSVVQVPLNQSEPPTELLLDFYTADRSSAFGRPRNSTSRSGFAIVKKSQVPSSIRAEYDSVAVIGKSTSMALKIPDAIHGVLESCSGRMKVAGFMCWFSADDKEMRVVKQSGSYKAFDVRELIRNANGEVTGALVTGKGGALRARVLFWDRSAGCFRLIPLHSVLPLVNEQCSLRDLLSDRRAPNDMTIAGDEVERLFLDNYDLAKDSSTEWTSRDGRLMTLDLSKDLSLDSVHITRLDQDPITTDGALVIRTSEGQCVLKCAPDKSLRRHKIYPHLAAVMQDNAFSRVAHGLTSEAAGTESSFYLDERDVIRQLRRVNIAGRVRYVVQKYKLDDGMVGCLVDCLRHVDPEPYVFTHKRPGSTSRVNLLRSTTNMIYKGACVKRKLKMSSFRGRDMLRRDFTPIKSKWDEQFRFDEGHLHFATWAFDRLIRRYADIQDNKDYKAFKVFEKPVIFPITPCDDYGRIIDGLIQKLKDKIQGLRMLPAWKHPVYCLATDDGLHMLYRLEGERVNEDLFFELQGDNVLTYTLSEERSLNSIPVLFEGHDHFLTQSDIGDMMTNIYNPTTIDMLFDMLASLLPATCGAAFMGAEHALSVHWIVSLALEVLKVSDDRIYKPACKEAARNIVLGLILAYYRHKEENPPAQLLGCFREPLFCVRPQQGRLSVIYPSFTVTTADDKQLALTYDAQLPPEVLVRCIKDQLSEQGVKTDYNYGNTVVRMPGRPDPDPSQTQTRRHVHDRRSLAQAKEAARTVGRTFFEGVKRCQFLKNCRLATRKLRGRAREYTLRSEEEGYKCLGKVPTTVSPEKVSTAATPDLLMSLVRRRSSAKSYNIQAADTSEAKKRVTLLKVKPLEEETFRVRRVRIPAASEITRTSDRGGQQLQRTCRKVEPCAVVGGSISGALSHMIW